MANLVIKNKSSETPSILTFKNEGKDDVKIIRKDNLIQIKGQKPDNTNLEDYFGDSSVSLRLGYSWEDSENYIKNGTFFSQNSYLQLSPFGIRGDTSYSDTSGANNNEYFSINSNGLELYDRKERVRLDSFGLVCVGETGDEFKVTSSTLSSHNDSTYVIDVDGLEIKSGTTFKGATIFNTSNLQQKSDYNNYFTFTTAYNKANVLKFQNASYGWTMQSTGQHDTADLSYEFRIDCPKNSINGENKNRIIALNPKGGVAIGGTTTRTTSFASYLPSYFDKKVEINKFLSVGCSDARDKLPIGASDASIYIINESDLFSGLYLGNNKEAARMISLSPTTDSNPRSIKIWDTTEGICRGKNIFTIKSPEEVIFDGLYDSYDDEADKYTPYCGTGLYVLGLAPKSWKDENNETQSYTWEQLIDDNKDPIHKMRQNDRDAAANRELTYKDFTYTNNVPSSCYNLEKASIKLYPVLTPLNAHYYTLSLERGGVVDGKVIFNKKIEVPGVTCLSDSSSYFRYVRVNKKAVVGTSTYEPINSNYSLSIHGKDSLYIENIADIGTQKPDNITRYKERAILNVVSSADAPCDFYLGSNGKGIWDFSVREVKDNNMLVLYNPIKGGYAAIINMLNDDTAKYEFTLQGRLIVGGATQLNSTLTVGTGDNNRDTKLNGKLTVTDKSTLGELAAGATALSSTLEVTGITTLKNKLTVQDGKDTVLGGTLQVKNTTTLGGTVKITGVTKSRASLQVVSNEDLPCDIYLGSQETARWSWSCRGTDEQQKLILFNAQHETYNAPTYPLEFTRDGNIYVRSNNLSLTGATTLSGTLTVGTTTSNKATTLNGALNVTGTTTLTNATLSGSLTANGTTNLGGTLSVSGNTTLSSNLIVNGNATFSKSLNANSGIMVSDSAEFNCESFIIKNSNKNIFNIESNEITIHVPLNVTASANNEQAMLNLINTVSNATCELKMGANSTALWGIRVRDDKADDGETAQQAHLGFGIYNHSTKRTNLLITPGGTTFFNGNVCFNDQVLLTEDSYGTDLPSISSSKPGRVFFKII